MGSGMGLVGRRRRGLAGGEGPAAVGGDAGLARIGGGLRERGAAAGLAEFGVDDAVRLAGAMAPGADQAVEFLTQGRELLAGDRRGRPDGGGPGGGGRGGGGPGGGGGGFWGGGGGGRPGFLGGVGWCRGPVRVAHAARR